MDNMNKNWAQVELYRWQHGELPSDNQKDFDEVEGLKNMAASFDKEHDDTNKWPAPFNVQSVLLYCADRIEELKQY